VSYLATGESIVDENRTWGCGERAFERGLYVLIN